MELTFRWHSYKYLPYERVLAAREVEALTDQRARTETDGVHVDANGNGWSRFGRVTYFRDVLRGNQVACVPQQAYLEASANGGSRPTASKVSAGPLMRKQNTRYSAHGLHEYKGKFNPQIVRAAGNICGFKPGDWILDPFCGSGTSLLEANHIGWNAIGLDLNPLGVEIAKAKLAAIRIPLEHLRALSRVITRRLAELSVGVRFDRPFSNRWIEAVAGKAWRDRLPNLGYLMEWFREPVLVQLSIINREVDRLCSRDARLILRVVLSDVLREVSLQDPDDLRIRRRKLPPANAPAIPMFVDAVAARVGNILTARAVLGVPTSTQDVLLGDARECASAVRDRLSRYGADRFDGAITSPPYATALPYIDTQRLSLTFLGLIGASEIRHYERRLIGNREIGQSQRTAAESRMLGVEERLPAECTAICTEMMRAIDPCRDGFRRRNMPALLYTYLFDMSRAFGQSHELLKRNARFALVVGPNSTKLGGRTFTIDTPRLLQVLAESRGFKTLDMIDLDTYQRYNVHKANSIRSERLIILQRV